MTFSWHGVLVLLAIWCSVTEPVDSLLQRPASRASPGWSAPNLAPLGRGNDLHVLQPELASRNVLRGGAARDGEDDLGGMLDSIARLKEEAARNPPLPPLVESAIQVVETWWIAAVIWIVNLELFYRGGLYQMAASCVLLIGLSLKIGKWASLVLMGSWVSNRAREAVKCRVRPPTSTVTLTYPPLSISGVGPNKFVTGGGGGRAADALPNRVTLLECDGDELGGNSDKSVSSDGTAQMYCTVTFENSCLVMKQSETFERRVEAVAASPQVCCVPKP